MGILTKNEMHDAWNRLKGAHPYGTTAQLYHVAKAMKGNAESFRRLGNDEMAGRIGVSIRLVERRVIITTNVLKRVFE